MADNLSMLADIDDGQPPSCVCQQADNDEMVACDGCQEWYHFTCVGIRKAPALKLFFCPKKRMQRMQKKNFKVRWVSRRVYSFA
jgi:hypothetical protein